MPARPLAAAAVCLGDELKDLSDEEQRQFRIESELIKDDAVERWEIEVEVGVLCIPECVGDYVIDGTSDSLDY